MNFWDWMTANEEVLSPGKGLFSTLHICLIIFLAVWLVSILFLFKKYPKFARIFTLIIVCFMLISRIFRMIFRVAVGADTFAQALPWHMCHIMCFVIGILFLSGSKKFITPVAIFAFFGGVLTFLFGDYYKYSVLTFYDIESIVLHIMLPTVTMYYLATKKLTYTYKSLNETVIFLVLLACYGEFGNLLMEGRNIMFLRENGLPFKIFPGHHLFTYMFLIAITFGLAYGILAIKNYIKKHPKIKNKKRQFEKYNAELEEEKLIENK